MAGSGAAATDYDPVSGHRFDRDYLIEEGTQWLLENHVCTSLMSGGATSAAAAPFR